MSAHLNRATNIASILSEKGLNDFAEKLGFGPSGEPDDQKYRRLPA
jgi:hypothetical protein